MKYTLLQWQLILDDYNQSNISKREYSRLKGLDYNQMLYWAAKLKDHRLSKLVELKVAKDDQTSTDICENLKSGIEITVGKVKIMVNNSTNQELLKQIVVSLAEII